MLHRYVSRPFNTVRVLNVLRQRVATLVDGHATAGRKTRSRGC